MQPQEKTVHARGGKGPPGRGSSGPRITGRTYGVRAVRATYAKLRARWRPEWRPVGEALGAVQSCGLTHSAESEEGSRRYHSSLSALRM